MRIPALALLFLPLAAMAQPSPQPQLVPPEKGAYWGAFVDFGDTEDNVTVGNIERFEKMLSKRLAIVASSSYWGEQSFPAANLELIARHGSIPMIFWSPWDKPYDQLKGPDRFGLTNILAGQWDAYIDRWADGAKAFGRPFMVSFANEMNGDWFPWSGWYYGGSNVVPPAAVGTKAALGVASVTGGPAWKGPQPLPGTSYQGPETFKAAWRYVVDRVRARGATNVLWVFQVNNYSEPLEKWNDFANYYPGPQYVDWLGLSIYGKQERNQDHWMDFDEDLLEEPYADLAAVDPSKPIMVSEFGVGEFPDIGDKAKWVQHAFATMSSPPYPRLKAAVYWNERWQNDDQTYSNLRVNSSLETLEAFRAGLKNPFWVDAPIWQTKPPGSPRSVVKLP